MLNRTDGVLCEFYSKAISYVIKKGVMKELSVIA